MPLTTNAPAHMQREFTHFQTRDLAPQVEIIRSILPQINEDLCVEALIANDEHIEAALEWLLQKMPPKGTGGGATTGAMAGATSGHYMEKKKSSHHGQKTEKTTPCGTAEHAAAGRGGMLHAGESGARLQSGGAMMGGGTSAEKYTNTHQDLQGSCQTSHHAGNIHQSSPTTQTPASSSSELLASSSCSASASSEQLLSASEIETLPKTVGAEWAQAHGAPSNFEEESGWARADAFGVPVEPARPGCEAGGAGTTRPTGTPNAPHGGLGERVEGGGWEGAGAWGEVDATAGPAGGPGKTDGREVGELWEAWEDEPVEEEEEEEYEEEPVVPEFR